MIIQLQQRVDELQQLLSQCDPEFLLDPTGSPRYTSHSRLSRSGADFKGQHLLGLESRRLLQSPADRTSRSSGLLADYFSGER